MARGRGGEGLALIAVRWRWWAAIGGEVMLPAFPLTTYYLPPQVKRSQLRLFVHLIDGRVRHQPQPPSAARRRVVARTSPHQPAPAHTPLVYCSLLTAHCLLLTAPCSGRPPRYGSRHHAIGGSGGAERQLAVCDYTHQSGAQSLHRAAPPPRSPSTAHPLHLQPLHHQPLHHRDGSENTMRSFRLR